MNLSLMASFKDQGGIRLITEIAAKIKSGFIPQTKVVCIFCDRPTAENVKLEFGDIPIIFESSAELKRVIAANLSNLKVEKDRAEYDRNVHRRLIVYKPDIILLIGYMLKASAWLCNKLPMFNLHPDIPGGFIGTWQEVIQQIIKAKRKVAGAMIHRVTPQLDKGQPLTYCEFSLEGIGYINLWNNPQMEQELKERIREEEFKRELPLLLLTLKFLAEAKISLEDSKDRDLSGEVEKFIIQYP